MVAFRCSSSSSSSSNSSNSNNNDGASRTINEVTMSSHQSVKLHSMLQRQV